MGGGITQADPLVDTVDSFKTVVKAIAGSQQHAFGKLDDAAKSFEKRRKSQPQECHIVCALLAELLSSGDASLVSFYYTVVDSYNSDKDFLFKTTGYQWGNHTGNAYEQLIYDAGARLRTCEPAFQQASTAWHIHQSWSQALLFEKYADTGSWWVQFPNI